MDEPPDKGKDPRQHLGLPVTNDLPTIGDHMLAPAQAPSAEVREDFEKQMSLAPRLTILLIAANVVIFIISLFAGSLDSREAIILAGALAREQVLAGEPWRLVSAMFLHGSLDHLIGNCIALYILGMACEHAYGLGRAGLLYLLAGVGGSLLSTAVSPGPSVGVSGAIFGLMGAGIVFFRKYSRRFIVRDNRIGIVLLVWALYSIATGFFEPYIDNAGHIGGLLVGAAVALCVHPALLNRISSAQT